MSKKKLTARESQKAFLEKLYANYNCGWAQGLRKITTEKGRMDKAAIRCRGVSHTYREMFAMGTKYAQAMEALGLGKGTLIPMCVSHCPESIFTLLGASLIGAAVTPFGEHFDADYIVERLERTGCKVLFVTDDKYGALKELLPKTSIEHIVMFSLRASYPEDVSEYQTLEEGFFEIVDRTPGYKAENAKIMDAAEFLKRGEDYVQVNGFEEARGFLSDTFSITYSSGTTNSHRPKPIVHPVKTYLGMGYIRTLETPDLNKFSKDGEIRTLVHIPLYSNTSLLAAVSDVLFLGGTMCLEHIYDEKFFPRSILINRPNQVIASTSHWISGMKAWDTDPLYKDADLHYLMSPFTAGEPASLGEERLVNRVFHRFHAAKNHPPFKFINALGMGGGDCENCGLWRLPHKATMEKLKRAVHFASKNVEKGYETYSVVDWAILDESGNHCGADTPGLLVIDSPFTMTGYDGLPEATAETKVTDAAGREWTSCRLWAYFDKFGEVFLKGRYTPGETYPLYQIDDLIQKDAKTIMSSRTVRLASGEVVAHVALQPECKQSGPEVLAALDARLTKSVPAEVMAKLCYKLRPAQYSFPLTGSGKRDGGALEKEGLAGTWRPER